MYWSFLPGAGECVHAVLLLLIKYLDPFFYDLFEFGFRSNFFACVLVFSYSAKLCGFNDMEWSFHERFLRQWRISRSSYWSASSPIVRINKTIISIFSVIHFKCPRHTFHMRERIWQLKVLHELFCIVQEGWSDLSCLLRCSNAKSKY